MMSELPTYEQYITNGILEMASLSLRFAHIFREQNWSAGALSKNAFLQPKKLFGLQKKDQLQKMD
jgi:hypothetical protein